MKWECTVCGKVHPSNPEQCASCGHTILVQHYDEPFWSRWSSSRGSTDTQGSTASGEPMSWRAFLLWSPVLIPYLVLYLTLLTGYHLIVRWRIVVPLTTGLYLAAVHLGYTSPVW